MVVVVVVGVRVVASVIARFVLVNDGAGVRVGIRGLRGRVRAGDAAAATDVKAASVAAAAVSAGEKVEKEEKEGVGGGVGE
jgi:hypothetical protein